MRWDELFEFKREPMRNGEIAVIAPQERVLVRVSGGDAAAFLQGQFCNDVDALNPNGIQLNGYCTPKGRLLAVFHLMRDGADFLMWFPTSETDALLKRLRLFAMRADVTFDIEDTLTVVALRGEALLSSAALGGLTPTDTGEGIRAGGLRAYRLSDAVPSTVLVGTQAHLLEALSASDALSPHSSDWWRRTRMQAGEPILSGAASDRFVPQMLNMDLIDGLSFSKGCYPGQEIVARTRYLGKQKRRMLHYTGSGDGALIRPGDPLLTTDGNAAGDMVSSVQVDGTLTAIAVVRLEYRASTLHHASGIELFPASLPYDPLEGTEYAG